MSDIVIVSSYAITSFDDEEMEIIRLLYQDGYSSAADYLASQNMSLEEMKCTDLLARKDLPQSFIETLIFHRVSVGKVFISAQADQFSLALAGWRDMSSGDLSTLITKILKWAHVVYTAKEMKQMRLASADGFDQLPDIYAGGCNIPDELELIRYLLKAGLSLGQAFYDVMGLTVPGEKKNLDKKQIKEIKLGFEAGLTSAQVMTYVLNGSLPYTYMAIQRKTLCSDPSVDLIAKLKAASDYKFKDYPIESLKQCLKAVQQGLDVTSMANPSFDELQSKQIRLGLLYNKIAGVLTTKQEAVDTCTSTFNNAQTAVTTTTTEITTVTNSITSIQAELDAANILLSTYQSSLVSTTSELTAAQETLVNTTTALTDATNAYNSVESTETLRWHISSVQSELATAIANNSSNVDALTAELADLEAQKAVIDAAKASAKETMDNAQTAYNEANTTVSTLSALVTELTSNVSTTASSVSEITGRMSAAETQLTNLNNTLVTQSTELEAATIALATATDELNILKAEMASTE